jgi:hypothetical protein
MATASSIATEKYVSLSTHKNNGDLVATPAWIAALPDGSIGFTTSPAARPSGSAPSPRTPSSRATGAAS